MSTNLEYKERERKRKKESRRQASKAQQEKEQHRARVRDKNVKTMEKNFVAAVRKWDMLAATKVKMSGIEKREKEHVRHFLHKTCK